MSKFSTKLQYGLYFTPSAPREAAKVAEKDVPDG
jgi:hypothetical protein